MFCIICNLMWKQIKILNCQTNYQEQELPSHYLFYNVIFEEYATKNKTVTSYGAIGSGGGIRNLKDGVVDFAASDAFLTDEEIKTAFRYTPNQETFFLNVDLRN